MQIDSDVITLLALLIMAVMSFFLYRSVPRDIADQIFKKGQEAAAKTPQTWDDEAMKLLRQFYDLLRAQQPPTGGQPPAPPTA